MAVSHAVVSVGTDPTALAVLPSGERALSASVQNASGVTVYVGDAEVTTTDYGYALPDGGELYLTMYEPGDTVYAVVDTGTAGVNVLTVEGK